MRAHDRKVVLGIMTDEEAMFDLLAKFLVKEGYEVRRVHHELSEGEDFALLIYAPTRNLGLPKSWFESLAKGKRALLIVQCCDEDYADLDENVVVMSERPLNLKQLSIVVERTIRQSGYKPARSPKQKLNHEGVRR